MSAKGAYEWQTQLTLLACRGDVTGVRKKVGWNIALLTGVDVILCIVYFFIPGDFAFVKIGIGIVFLLVAASILHSINTHERLYDLIQSLDAAVDKE